MARQHMEIRQTFDAPVEGIFKALADHESLGKILQTDIKRVVDSQDDNKNGVGSVRRISSFPVPAYEETVVTYEPNRLIEYVVSKGSPIKNHSGRMEFSEEQGKTSLLYTVDFEPKLPFIFLGPILKRAIDRPIRKGIERLARKQDA